MTQPNVLRRRQRGSAVLGGAAPSPTRRESYRSTGPPVGRGVATVAGPGERAHAFEEAGTTLGQRQAAAQSLAEEQAAGRRDAERSRVQALRDEAAAAHEEGQAALSSEFDAAVPEAQATWDASFALAMNTAEALQEVYDWGAHPSDGRAGWLPSHWQAITGMSPASAAAINAQTGWSFTGHEFGVGHGLYTAPDFATGMTSDWKGTNISGLSRTEFDSAIAFLRAPETLAAVESFRSGGGAGTGQMAHRDALSAELHRLATTVGPPVDPRPGGLPSGHRILLPREWRDSLTLSSAGASTFNQYFGPGFAAAAALGAENVPGSRASVGGYEAEEYLPPGLSSEEAALGITP